MAYTVNKTNPLALPSTYTVQDAVLNTETDLSLVGKGYAGYGDCLLYTSPSPRDLSTSRMPSSA